MDETRVARTYQSNLMVAGMAARDRRGHPRNQIDIAFNRFDQSRHRREALLDMTIGRPQPFVGRFPRDRDLALLHENPGARKRRLEDPRRPRPHDPAAM